MATKDAYDTLSEKLGFPGSSRLRTILEAVMTPLQARLAEALPGSVSEVAQKTGMSEDDARKNLEELFRRGAVFPKGDFAKRDYYKFARDIVQFHDATHATVCPGIEGAIIIRHPLFQGTVDVDPGNQASGRRSHCMCGLVLQATIGLHSFGRRGGLA